MSLGIDGVALGSDAPLRIMIVFDRAFSVRRRGELTEVVEPCANLVIGVGDELTATRTDLPVPWGRVVAPRTT